MTSLRSKRRTVPLTISPARFLELVVHHLLFRAADALEHGLLGGLRGDAPEVFGRHLDLHVLAELGGGLELLRPGQQGLAERVHHLFHDGQARQRADLARLGIDVDAQVARGADALLGGLKQRAADRFDEDLAFDPLLALEVIQGGNQFTVHRK